MISNLNINTFLTLKCAILPRVLRSTIKTFIVSIITCLGHEPSSD